MKLFILLTFLVFSKAEGQNSVSLELLSSEYILSEIGLRPSCKLLNHRRMEREKVLREMKHNLQIKMWNADIFFKDDYVLNKFFLEKEIWVDETVILVNTWRVMEGLEDELKTAAQGPFLSLSGDGVDWQSPMMFFPEDVKFYWDEKAQTMVSQHTAYYIDYCSPRKKNQLKWFPFQSEKPKTTQSKIIEILTHLKEI